MPSYIFPHSQKAVDIFTYSVLLYLLEHQLVPRDQQAKARSWSSDRSQEPPRLKVTLCSSQLWSTDSLHFMPGPECLDWEQKYPCKALLLRSHRTVTKRPCRYVTLIFLAHSVRRLGPGLYSQAISMWDRNRTHPQSLSQSPTLFSVSTLPDLPSFLHGRGLARQHNTVSVPSNQYELRYLCFIPLSKKNLIFWVWAILWHLRMR